MESLTVWTFADPHSADDAVSRLERLAATHVIRVEDSAVVAWPAGRRTPAIRALGSLTGPGALWSGFWGMLLALLFVVPVAGPSLGAAAGAFAGGLAAFGVEDDFVKRVRDDVVPGTSALFILGAGPVKPVAEALDAYDVRMIRSDLSPQQERQLHEALGADAERQNA